MQSWKLLQLEPAHLRTPDEMKAKARLGPDGRGLAATLSRLLRSTNDGGADAIRAKLTNRLHGLLDDVVDVWVDADEKRELLTLMARSKDGVEFRARDLSDGTLRFLALAVLEQDPTWGGLLCMEEPENGIHPTRIPAILELLQDLTVDLDAKTGDDNPLRQVIINTHSPEVVGLVPDDSFLFAETAPATTVDDPRCRSLQLSPLAGTWRPESQRAATVSKGAVLEILNALPVAISQREARFAGAAADRRPRVAEREDLQGEWMLGKLGCPRCEIAWAELRAARRVPPDLPGRIRLALDLYPCDLLFVHRDAESQSIQDRQAEIRAALPSTSQPHVCVIPVRMTEAWLLFDERAIFSPLRRLAAFREVEAQARSFLREYETPRDR